MKFRVTALNLMGCIALGCCALTSEHAQAGSEDVSKDVPKDVPSVRVSYADLNLDSDRGAKALYVRIVSAAKRVCPPYLDRNLPAKSRALVCQKLAVERAVSEVNHPRLAAIHTVRRTA